MSEISKAHAMQLASVSDAPSSRELGAALDAAPADEISVARAERDALIRIYGVRRRRLAGAGLPTAPIDSFVSRLRAWPDRELWLFIVRDGERAAIGVTDNNRSTLVAALVAPPHGSRAPMYPERAVG